MVNTSSPQPVSNSVLPAVRYWPDHIIDWASQHDWFACVAVDRLGFFRGVTVQDVTIQPDNTVSTVYLTMLDRVELRNWAGY